MLKTKLLIAVTAATGSLWGRPPGLHRLNPIPITRLRVPAKWQLPQASKTQECP
jgi:hypothetical protein